MKAALLKCPNQIELIDYSLPKIKVDELLINVDTCGLCGTDYYIFRGSLLNPFIFSRAIELLASNKINVKVFNPVQAKLEDLKDLLSQPKNLSVTKYQITLN